MWFKPIFEFAFESNKTYLNIGETALVQRFIYDCNHLAATAGA